MHFKETNRLRVDTGIIVTMEYWMEYLAIQPVNDVTRTKVCVYRWSWSWRTAVYKIFGEVRRGERVNIRSESSRPVLLTELLAGVSRVETRSGNTMVGRRSTNPPVTRVQQNCNDPSGLTLAVQPADRLEGIAWLLEKISTDTAFQTFSSRLLAIHLKAEVLGCPAPMELPSSPRISLLFPTISVVVWQFISFRK